MEHINIIASNIVYLCDYIKNILKCCDKNSNIRNLLFDCINYHRENIGLERFYIRKPRKDWYTSFEIELTFYNRPRCILVKFSNMDFYPTLEYKASIENTLIIVTKPLYSYIDGIKYCGYEHNCLYFDQFTEKPPIRLSLGNLPASELLYCGYKYIPISCINAIHFYNKLTELERNNLIFVNVDIDWLKFRDEFQFHIFERIDRNNYTCIIKPCSISKEEVDNWNLKNDILVINENAVISSVSQEQWIRKAIISIEYHYSFDYSNQGYYTAIIDLILDYNLSGKAVADCIFSIATKESIDKRNIRAKLNALYSFRRIE